MGYDNMEKEIKCPYCNKDGVLKYGKYKGVQRYWCKKCKRKFKADDTLFHGKTPANQVASALNMYYEGMSIKAVRAHLEQEYGNTPSTSTIYEWIIKYTRYITGSIKDCRPKVGDTWVANETVLEINGQNVWFWDIIDEKTCYLLASRISRNRTIQDIQIIMEQACNLAGKVPKTIITEKLHSYLDVIKSDFKGKSEHGQSGPFNLGNNSNLIELCRSTLKQRSKVMHGLKSLQTGNDFMQGWLALYNFIMPNHAIKDKTPAEVAGINYPYKSWSEIIRKHKPSEPVPISDVESSTMCNLETHAVKQSRLSPQLPKISNRAVRLK